MKIKLDENLPAALAVALRARGHDVDSVRDEGLTGRDDAAVWEATQRDERFLITQDLDFSDMRRFSPGTHAGLLLVRLAEPGRLTLLKRIDGLFALEDVERWRRCFVIVTDHKVRMRAPA